MAQIAGLTGADLTEVQTVADEVAAVMYAGVTQLQSAVDNNSDPIDALTSMAEAAAVAQGSSAASITAAVDAVEADATDTSLLSTLVSSYSGANLTAALDNATIGDVTGSTFNDAPVADGSVAFTMNEDGTLTITEAQLLGSSSDADGDDLHVANLAVTGGTLQDNGNDTWTFEPAADFNGSIDLSYDVTDGTTSDTVATTITVAAVNDAPVIDAISDPSSILEDA